MIYSPALISLIKFSQCRPPVLLSQFIAKEINSRQLTIKIAKKSFLCSDYLQTLRLAAPPDHLENILETSYEFQVADTKSIAEKEVKNVIFGFLASDEISGRRAVIVSVMQRARTGNKIDNQPQLEITFGKWTWHWIIMKFICCDLNKLECVTVGLIVSSASSQNFHGHKSPSSGVLMKFSSEILDGRNFLWNRKQTHVGLASSLYLSRYFEM